MTTEAYVNLAFGASVILDRVVTVGELINDQRASQMELLYRVEAGSEVVRAGGGQPVYVDIPPGLLPPRTTLDPTHSIEMQCWGETTNGIEASAWRAKVEPERAP